MVTATHSEHQKQARTRMAYAEFTVTYARGTLQATLADDPATEDEMESAVAVIAQICEIL